MPLAVRVNTVQTSPEWCIPEGGCARKGWRISWASWLVGLALLFIVGCHQPFGVYHNVQSGETLSKISSYYDVPVDDLVQVNYLRHPDQLSVGDRIFVPGARKIRRKPVAGAVASNKARSEKKSKAAAGKKKKQNNQRKSSSSTSQKSSTAVAARAAGKKPRFIWPVRGQVLTRFGMVGGKANNGLDIGAAEGTPVKASAKGEVIYVTDNQRGYGKLILIQHPYDYITVYAHNQRNLVREGDSVSQGQTIATVGKTGNASRSHLHFEIRHKRRAVNPKQLLP